MSSIQTGTPASEITPQGYRNSTQSGVVQRTLNSSHVQSTNNQLLNTETEGKLQVVTESNNQLVLGASTSIPVTQNQVKTGGSVSFLLVILLVLLAAGTIFFFAKFKISFAPDEDEE